MKKILSAVFAFILVFSAAYPVLLPKGSAFSATDVPAFSDKPYAAVNGNTPFFSDAERTEKVSFEYYGDLDGLGRCTLAYANIGLDIMPTAARGEIGSVKPSGWQSVKYDVVDGKYLYNRCHLIGYQLSAENANRKNLITGTRYLNVTGMLPFENMVADYVKETGNHVLYRVTPLFTDEELVARGVLMEAYSVEDAGDGICFCVYCYNVQPGVTIDYRTGNSCLTGSTAPAPSPRTGTFGRVYTFIINTNSKKFHKETCGSGIRTAEKNKAYLAGTAEDLLAEGYIPCGVCHPEHSDGVTYFYGDVDLNGCIEAADARLILRAAVGIEILAEIPAELADTYADGMLTAADARLALRAAVGLEVIV